MVVTGIFYLENEDVFTQSVAADSDQVYEEKIAEDETLVAMRAKNLRQALFLGELLCQAGAQNVQIDSHAV